MATNNVIIDRVAEALLMDYTTIYYVNMRTSEYWWYTFDTESRSLRLGGQGNDFFVNMARDAEKLVHEEDRHLFTRDFSKEKMLEMLETEANGGMHNIVYRLLVDGEPVYHQMRLIREEMEDEDYLILGVMDIDDEVVREREQIRALKQANDLAHRDEMTGVKNKNAFNIFIRALQRNITRGKEVPFAVVMFDMNDLKDINDSRGHSQGDDYLIRAGRMICKVFSHSPVFRVGGDEFAVVLMQRDYAAREILCERFRQQVYEHLRAQNGPVVASGMAVYDPDKNPTVASVVEEADSEMYKDKIRLKSGIIDKDGREQKVDRIIPEGRKRKLDQLFHALELAAEETYVYICDMNYDYSRWSRGAVEYFGMPSEYLYDAGYTWETHIHPEDRGAYHAAMDGIFYGSSTSHDMQYRAANSRGEYEMCTCRGLVLPDRDGSPEYFCGTIRKHSAHAEIDSITGLRNQYGFLEDLQENLRQERPMEIVMLGISRFSELNDVYGYHFGNRLLQKVGRYLMENVGGLGMVYRLDGTKFAVVGSSITEDMVQKSYHRFRSYFRDGFYMDNKYIILEMNAAHLMVDNFNIDRRTINACLTYAYGISKNERHGDLVKFTRSMGEDREQWIEKIQAIRASITRGFKGFFLMYQPVVDARTGKLQGAEALIRWQGEPYGLVPPDYFIPVLEKDSLFPNLGRWILRRAILDARDMLEDHPDFIVNVNLAYTQIERPAFTDEVLDILRDEEYPPDHLCLEITERCRLLDSNLLHNTVATLQSHGIRVAMDDFGTGYSSIGILKDLPTDLIKIDRSFTSTIETNEKDRVMIGKFSEVAAIYGMDVCVEGVETEAMVEILRDFPVQCLQGYYYSKPLLFDDLLEWEKERQEKGQQEKERQEKK